MKQTQIELSLETPGRGATEFTSQLERAVADSGLTTGLAVAFCRHTSCSLTIQENADPSAMSDLLAWLERLAPDGDPLYAHSAEGPDDMPAHLRSVLTSSSESIPIVNGRLALGTWQGLFLLEHRSRPHRRTIVLHLSGD